MGCTPNKRKKNRRTQVIPRGIQVSLIESLRFLLLKAVIIPMTKKTFGRSLDISPPVFVGIGDLFACEALAAASCISRLDIVRSSDLEYKNHAKLFTLPGQL